MLVIAANSLCAEPCGQPLTFDLSLGKSKTPNTSKVFPRSVHIASELGCPRTCIYIVYSVVLFLTGTDNVLQLLPRRSSPSQYGRAVCRGWSRMFV